MIKRNLEKNISKRKWGKKFVVAMTMSICMLSSMLAYAATYTLNDPIIESYATTSRVTMKITCSLTSNPADYMRICVTPYYKPRGGKEEQKETTKYINSYTSRVENLSGYVSYTNAVDSHKTYTKIKQQGQKGINSSGNSYTTVISKETKLNN